MYKTNEKIVKVKIMYKIAKCQYIISSKFKKALPYRCSRNVRKDGFCNQHHPDTIKMKRENKIMKKERCIKKIWRFEKGISQCSNNAWSDGLCKEHHPDYSMNSNVPDHVQKKRMKTLKTGNGRTKDQNWATMRNLSRRRLITDYCSLKNLEDHSSLLPSERKQISKSADDLYKVIERWKHNNSRSKKMWIQPSYLFLNKNIFF